MKKDCALHYRGWAVFFHEMFWFMQVSPWIMDGHVWWSCKHSHEDWRKEPGNNSRNNSPTWTKGDHPHDFNVVKGSLFREYSWSCPHSNTELFGRLLNEGFSKGGQFDHSREDKKIARCWHSPWFSNTYETQGLLIHLVQNIYVHKGEKSFPSKHSQVFSCTNCTRRIISGDVRGDSLQKEPKTCECEGQNATKLTPALAEISLDSDVDLDENIVCLCLALMNLLFSIAHPSSNFATMERLHFLDAASTWNLMRRTWDQRSLPWRQEFQEFIQVPWKWKDGSQNKIARAT